MYQITPSGSKIDRNVGFGRTKKSSRSGILYSKYQEDTMNAFTEANNNCLFISQSRRLTRSISLSGYFYPAYPLNRSHNHPQIKRAGAWNTSTINILYKFHWTPRLDPIHHHLLRPAKRKLRNLNSRHCPSLTPITGRHVSGDPLALGHGVDVVRVSAIQDDLGVCPCYIALVARF